MKIGIVQPDISLGRPKENIEHISTLLDKLFKKGKPDVVILPELWYTGYDYESLEENAVSDGEVLNIVKGWMRDYPVLWIPGSFPVKDNGRIYNRTYAISPFGDFITYYDKIHLFGPMSEKRYFTEGEHIVTFEYQGVMFGLSICYDLRFPELFRILTLKGARVIFLPTEWPTPRMEHFITLMKARAIENQVYMVSANRVGKDLMSEFSGTSLVVDPWGKEVCVLGEKEEVAICEIDLSLIERVRKKIPVLSDRREDVYHLQEFLRGEGDV